MEVTNISTNPHRYVALDGHRWIWGPGETLDVPEDVAGEVLAVHEGTKLVRGRPGETSAATASVEPIEPTAHETADLGRYEDRQMRPSRSRRRG
jgi:hypothetical protein